MGASHRPHRLAQGHLARGKYEWYLDGSRSSAGWGRPVGYQWTIDARWGASCGCWQSLSHAKLIGTKTLLRYKLPRGVEVSLMVTDMPSKAAGSAQFVMPPTRERR